MEMRIAIWEFERFCRNAVCIIGIMLCMHQHAAAQQIYTVKDGRMYIELSKHLPEASLDSFINRFELTDLALKFFIKTNSADTLKLLGWHLDKNNDQAFAISKALISSEDLVNIADKIVFTEKSPGFAALFPAVDNGLIYGYNRFRNKSSFTITDSVVRFFLRGMQNAKHVTLAGSFNNWNPEAVLMARTDSGWVADVKLGPGKYWYKFVADGNWMTDEDNLLRENDGMGNINSVFYRTNYLFRLDGYSNAKKVFLAGSFNRWKPNELQMMHAATGWVLPLYLAEGTHTYKFVIDGDWKTDPANPDRFPNEFNDSNSVIRNGKPYLFTLKGYSNASHVLLTGTFNGWRKDELYMNRTDSGWQLAYTLGPGNYEYRFIVDRKEITDPANTLLTDDNPKEANSFLILQPNYTFRLKGYPNAKKVFLAGDFNNYDPNALGMKRVGDEWQFSVHLTRGKHIYKFVVDGKWIRDPDNPLWEQNKFGTGDSVIWFE